MARIDLEQGVQVTTPDGVRLNADLLRPAGHEPVPALLTVTPYTTSFCWRSASRLARAGYGVLVVDCRGRGGSEGSFSLYDDGADGAACVAWLAEQRWCTGAVGLFGGSYSGLNQWQIAAEAPPALRAMAPMVAPMPGFDADWFRGVLPLNDVRWSALVQGRACHMDLLSDEDFWTQHYLEHYRSGAAPDSLTTMLGRESTALAPMIEHPVPGSFWDARVPTKDAFAAIDIPVLTITGTADDAQQGALEFRRRHLAARPDADHRLLVGPWTHGGERSPARHTADDDTPDAAQIDTIEKTLLVAFFDETLRGAARDERWRAPAQVYVSGRERWRAVQCLDAEADSEADAKTDAEADGGTLTLHLEATGRLAGDAAATAASARCVIDGRDTAAGDLEARDDAPSLMAVLAGAEDVDWYCGDRFDRSLTFTSAPLEQPLDVVGRPSLTLCLELDAADADVAVLLVELRSDGSRRLLSSTHQSLRWRDGDGPGAPWRAGEVEALRLRHFRLVAHRLQAGSRLVLQLRLLDSIHYQRNAQVLSEQRPITLRVHTGAEYGSALTLPTAQEPSRS